MPRILRAESLSPPCGGACAPRRGALSPSLLHRGPARWCTAPRAPGPRRGSRSTGNLAHQPALELWPRDILLEPRQLGVIDVLADLAAELLDRRVGAILLELVQHARAYARDEEDLRVRR